MSKEGTILKNLIGKRFGRLTVVGEGNLVEYGNQGKKTRQWECKCDCGKIVFVKRGKLTTKNTQSCGCLRSEYQKSKKNKNYMSQKQKKCIDSNCLGYIDKTEYTLIKNPQKLFKHNTSGIRGVFFDKRKQKYISHIKYQQKKYHLGTFDNIEDAREARIKAEKELFLPVCKKYEKTCMI